MTTKKKMLVHVTSSLKVGGAETVLCKLLEKLPRDKFEHKVIYFHAGPMRRHIEDLGITTYHIKGFIALYDPFFWWRLLSLLYRLQPDLIHSLLWAANVSSRITGLLLRIPVVSVYHNNIDQDGLLRNIFDIGTRFGAAKLVAVSSEVAQSVVNTMAKRRSEIVVIKNGIDVDVVKKKSAQNQISRESLGLLAEHFVIGSVGRLCAVKNYTLLLQAFALVYQNESRSRLVLVGQGEQEQMLRDLADKLGVAPYVIFVVGKQAYGYYPIFDIFVQTSDKEGISMALLEAMSCGLPCVVTSQGSQHQVIISMCNGIVVPAGDKQLLSMVLKQLFFDDNLKKKLGTKACYTVEQQFNEHAMINRYNDIFQANY